MEDIVYYTILFDYYGSLFTEKQQQYFKDYYFENLSFREIASRYGVSPNAVYHQLKDVKSSLESYENVLHLVSKQQKLEKLYENVDDEKLKIEIKKIIAL